MSFRDAVNKRNIVFVVGAGVSIGATNGAESASWRGLIEDGINRVSAMSTTGVSAGWPNMVRGMLDEGYHASDTSLMISAASQVSTKLKALGQQAFADWLHDTIGSLETKDHATITALRAFGFPIVTTNYDTLLDAGQPVSWRDGNGLQSILAGESSSVGHLHGVWSDPASIILSEADYAKHAESRSIQALQQAMATIKTVIYVGYGNGLDDPNFSNLLDWHRSVFSPSSMKHFRLCLDGEIPDLQRLHAGDNIAIQSYGNSYSDLPKFLAEHAPHRDQLSLTTAGIMRDPVAESKSDFEEAMRTHAVVLFPMDGNPEGRAPIVTPPLLPVPYATYVQRRTDRKELDAPLDRLNPREVADTLGITIVVSEESGGLTTTLRWLTLRAAESSLGAIPAYLPFNQCTNKTHPVRSALKPVLRSIGLHADSTGALPPIVLAIDDVHAHGRFADAALREVAQLGVPQVFIGCRLGEEDEILRVLRSSGANPAIRYLGRFETKEVTELLAEVAPGQVDTLVARVVDAFVRTNLPRTPMTVASIIYILMHGDSPISSTASQSSILEQYASILLGRGNPLEDARDGIEAGGRESVLASLAELFVARNSRTLSEPEVISHFTTHFKRVGWKESETRLLESMVRRGLLRRTTEGIEFQHNSLVYLFAAKRATTHHDFLETLLERPLYYARIVQVHAGLARSNASPLERLMESFSDRLASVGFDPGTPYAPIRQIDPPADLEAGNYEEEGSTSEILRTPSPGLTALDYPEPLIPLFSEDADLPVLVEFSRMLDLMSGVLRDADQIEDLEMKKRALRVVLEGWGHYISAVANSVSFRDLVDTLAEKLEREDILSEPLDRDLIADIFERVIPVGAAMSRINFSLKSRTLLLPVEEELVKADYSKDELLVGTAILLALIAEDGWVAKVRLLISRSPRLSVWFDFFRFDLERCFMSSASSSTDREAALEELVEIEARCYSFDSAAALSRYKDRMRTKHRRNRLLLDTRGRLEIDAS